MKYFILAGEASGDKQAALLCREILIHDRHAVIYGWGGEEMIAAGAVISVHYSKLAFMGFMEVITHLPSILHNFRQCKKEIDDFKPDAVILVDYPGFNLRMAGWCHRNGYRVYYYISPQLWAWHTSRVHAIRETVRRMYVILPFEKEFYKKYNVDAVYIGHPLARESLKHAQPSKDRETGHIALLPGSRKHEVDKILPVMVKVAELTPSKKFYVVAVNHLPLSLYLDIIRNAPNISISTGNMREVLLQCEAAIVTSGTATLETALSDTPQVVVYKGNPVSFSIAKRIVKVKYISLVNLILDMPLVPELIQHDCTANHIREKLNHILLSPEIQRIRKGYQKLRELLVAGGGPQAAAMDIINDLRENNQVSDGKIQA